jgi:phthiodiolone/phenolphthiodiolone dimycocerosates ketoreductase
MTVETAVNISGDRHLPWEVTAMEANAILESGVVDYIEVSDQPVGFLPPTLWNEKNVPAAAIIDEPDSLDAGIVTATVAVTSAPGMGVTIGTDCIRTSPVEFIQTMWSLAKLTKGKALFHVGAGEVKQCTPYGHKRSQGLARMEDLCRIFNLMWDSEGPVHFEGNHTTLDGAYLGSVRSYRPQMWALGGGPRLMDLATSYLDGAAVAVPNVWSTPDQAATEIARLREQLERKGRDPNDFRFGMWSLVLLHEDADTIDKALDNAVIRWQSAIFGRVNPQDWRKEGIEPAVPDGWTYHLKLKPLSIEQSFVNSTLARTNREMARRSFIHGTPKAVAGQLQGWIDAGIDWVMPVDYLRFVSSMEEAADALNRTYEVCRYIKGQLPQEFASDNATPTGQSAHA